MGTILLQTRIATEVAYGPRQGPCNARKEALRSPRQSPDKFNLGAIRYWNISNFGGAESCLKRYIRGL